jgi:arginase family enzyme
MDLIQPNFLNLEPKASDPERSGVMVLPLPLDITASWKRGTAEGPAAIIAASHHIEFYDEELDAVPFELVGGIATTLPRAPGRAPADGGNDLRARVAHVRPTGCCSHSAASTR